MVDGFFTTAYAFGVNAPEASGNVVIKSQLPLFVRYSDPWKVLVVEQKKEGPYSIVTISQKVKLFKFPGEKSPIFNKENTTAVDVSSMESWKEYVKPMAAKYEKTLSEKRFPESFEKIVEKATVEKTTLDKINRVTSELAKVMTYSGNWTSFEKMFYPNKLSEIGKMKIGDCKDFSLATVAMLRKLGITASVALTYRSSPSAAGEMRFEAVDEKMPQGGMFNHAIVKVQDQGNTYWIDPTNLVSNAGYIFSDIAGANALEVSIKTENIERIPYSGIEQNSISFEKVMEIRPDHTGETTTKFSLSGDFSKIVTEMALTKDEDTAKKVLSVFNRNNPAQAKSRFEGVDLKNRITAKSTGVERTMGEQVLRSDEGKLYLSIPLTVLLRSFFDIANKNRVTDAYMGGQVKETSIITVKGYDFVGFPEGCTILSPWFVVQRNFIKTDDGFKVLDDFSFLKNTITAKDIKSDKFSMTVGDIAGCAGTQSVEVRALVPDEKLATRLKDYNLQKAKEKFDIGGPGSIEGAREAYHIVENLLQTKPKDKDLLILKARAVRRVGYKNENIDRGEYFTAAENILNVLAVDYPNDGVVWMQKTWGSYFRKDKAEMSKNFQKAYSFATKDYDFYNLGAQVSERLGNRDAAKGAYLKAFGLAKTPEDKSAASVGLADALLSEGEIDNGLAYYRQAIIANPKNAWIQGNFVNILNQLKKWDEAIAVGEKTAKVSPYGMLLTNLADSYNGKARDLYAARSSAQGAARETLFNEVESAVMQGLRHSKHCDACLVTMANLYRMRAIEKQDKELAQKAMNYYEMSVAAGDWPITRYQQSTTELNLLLKGSRMPASASGPGAIVFPKPLGTIQDLQR
jgi:tetratricopeptide (TPR) repeat protein/predicted transglutaminase-like cysteine proteinase